MISPELAAFTGLDVNESYQRSKIASCIITYAREKRLLEPKNICLDDALKKLLNETETIRPRTSVHRMINQHLQPVASVQSKNKEALVNPTNEATPGDDPLAMPTVTVDETPVLPDETIGQAGVGEVSQAPL